LGRPWSATTRASASEGVRVGLSDEVVEVGRVKRGVRFRERRERAEEAHLGDPVDLGGEGEEGVLGDLPCGLGVQPEGGLDVRVNVEDAVVDLNGEPVGPVGVGDAVPPEGRLDERGEALAGRRGRREVVGHLAVSRGEVGGRGGPPLDGRPERARKRPPVREARDLVGLAEELDVLVERLGLLVPEGVDSERVRVSGAVGRPDDAEGGLVDRELDGVRLEQADEGLDAEPVGEGRKLEEILGVEDVRVEQEEPLDEGAEVNVDVRGVLDRGVEARGVEPAAWVGERLGLGH
jgi:hypothetical protein